MLAETGNLFAPLFAPLGWGDWKPAVATINGLIAKENVVGTFGVLYAAHGEEQQAPTEAPEEATLPRSHDYTKANALSALTVALWQGDSATRKAVPTQPAAEEPAEPADDDEKEEIAGVAGDVRASGAFSSLGALSFMLFNLLCAPCFAACGAIRREMNSTRWTWFAIGYMTLWAYTIAFITYQLGLYFSQGTMGSAQILAGILALLVIFQVVRPNPHKNNH